MTTRTLPLSTPVSKPRRSLRQFLAQFSPDASLLRGAAWLIDLAVIGFSGYFFMQLTTTLPNAAEFVIGLVLGTLLVLLGDLIRTLATAFGKRLPRNAQTAVLGLFAAAFAMFSLFLGPLPLLVSAAGVLLCLGVIGGVVVQFWRGSFFTLPRWQQAMAVGLAVIALGALIYGGLWLGASGVATPVAAYTPPPMDSVTPLTVAHPGEPGRFEVRTLFYGSGTDRQRPEFGPSVEITTQPVDARPLLPSWSGPLGTIYWEYWGFNTDALPLNGRVWYPAGDGPFPLVLMVHGNHAMSEFSDPGYAYLGEHLASQGYIAVSVDENFLNGHGFPILPEMGNENDARAWLLLKHLEVWRSWNRQVDNPFRGKVDLERIALIGHSRGGEAVYIAGAFNRLSQYPDNGNIRFNFDFGIRSIIAFAPVDGQYYPAGTRTPLSNVDFLVLQGSYDGDMAAFDGIRHYQRVQFTDGEYHFKTALYIDHANHGQFNTVWGRVDNAAPKGWFMNYDPIMPGEAQRQIALTWISGFLEASLRGNRDYLPMFRDYRTALQWLPETRYINRFTDSNMTVLADFEEDIDLTTTTRPGGSLTGSRLLTWYETNPPLRWNWQENQAVMLGWNTPEGIGTASYSIHLPEMSLAPEAALVLTIADQGQIPEVPDFMRQAGIVYPTGQTTEAVAFTLQATDGNGVRAALPISSVGFVPPPIHVQLVKSGFFDVMHLGTDSTELQFQTITVPLAAFRQMNPDFDPAQLAGIRLIFDQTTAGTIALGEVTVSGLQPS